MHRVVIGRTNLPLVYEGDATFYIAQYGRKVGAVEKHVELFHGCCQVNWPNLESQANGIVKLSATTCWNRRMNTYRRHRFQLGAPHQLSFRTPSGSTTDSISAIAVNPGRSFERSIIRAPG